MFFSLNFAPLKIFSVMAVTRLERKGRVNKARAKNLNAKIKQLQATPVIKKVDIEELKAEFNK